MPKDCVEPGKIHNIALDMRVGQQRPAEGMEAAVFMAKKAGWRFNFCVHANRYKIKNFFPDKFFNANISWFHIILCLLLFPALCPVVPVYAANIYWNAATGKWETDTNWSPVQVPGISDDVTIDNNGTAQVDSTTGTAPTHSLFVGYNYNQAGTLELTGGGRVTASYAITLGSGNNSVGTVTIDGIGSVLQSNGNLTVGYSGTGVLKLTNGGTATAIGIFLGSTTGSFGTSHGIITVDGINSLLSAGDALSVGAVGNGTLELTNSGKATAKGNISIGDLAGSTGTVTVANSGSVLESTGGYLTVGNYGIGELHLTDSGKATSAYSIYIGSKVNSTGTVTVDGSGSELNNLTGGMWVGYSGTGTLNVTDGGKANSGGLGINIGRNATGIGTVTVDGNGSELNTNSSIGVGYDGTGVLTLTNGGKAVSILGIVLGENAGSSGTVSVDGTGSALTSNDQLIVGYQGEGELLLTGGGQAISASSIWLGYNAGSTGAVTVDGTGSLLESMGTSGMDGLYVGNSGTGTLEITGGGKATSAGGIYIGNQINSSGTVTVDGTGSLLESTGSILTVGNSGTGFLSLTDGGVVIADGNINIGYGSSGIGTVTIAGGSELKTKNFFQMLYVGYNGEGELHLTDSAKASAFFIWIGQNDGSTGLVTVDRDSILQSTNGILYIGSSGTGILELTNGGQAISASHISLGLDSSTGSSGTVTVDGTGSLLQNTSGNLNVGESSTGTLEITNGGKATSASDILIGDKANSHGTVTVDGTGSVLESGENTMYGLFVGNSGTGTLTLSNGGKAIATGGIFIGTADTGSGTVTVDGTDSLLESTDGPLNIGYYGTGSLALTDGGKASAYSGIGIGCQSTGHGTVTVDGAGSLLENLHGGISVGGYGTGTLTITNGGKTTSGTTIYIGDRAGSSGTVTIDGTGSLLQSGLYLFVGEFGTGSLTLTDGGKATSANTIFIGYDTGSNGTTTIGSGSSLTATTGNVYVGGTNTVAGGKGLLAGTGTVSANGGAGNVVVYNTGTLSAGDVAGQIGTLNITGNLDMRSGSTLLVDYNDAATNNIDKILVSGTATFGSTLNVSLSSLMGVTTLPGRNLVETQGGITTAAPTGIFTLNGLTTTGSRIDLSHLTLVLANGNSDLQIGGTAFGDNKFVTWTGADAVVANQNKWDITSINWTDDADGSPISFLDGDAVTFNTDAPGVPLTVDIQGTQKTIAQMTVTGDKNLTINGNILADNTLSTLSALTNGSLTKTGTGTLTLNGNDSFKGAITIDGGTLALAGGSTVTTRSTAGNISIGKEAGAVGTVTVDGTGSQLQNYFGYLHVGESGTGALEITDGGKTISSSLDIGYSAGSNGTASVDGSGSVLQTTGGSIYVGNYGTGTLNVTDGGKATSGFHIYIGDGAGSSGTATVDGTGSVLETTYSTAYLYIGRAGTGELNLTNGGKATLESDIYIGFTAIGNGTVTVDGSGSALESTGFGYLYVGDRGTGSLVLTDGGKATSVRDIDIGCETGSHGTVLVGTGSSLTSTTGNVYVGGGSYAAGGTGLLAGTGTVSANAGAGNVVVYNTGTLSAGDAAEQIGTLNIAGNLDMRSGSTMLVDFNSATSGIAPFSTAGNIDKILVSGTATFGSTLNVSLSSVVGISTLPGRNIVETQGGITTAVPTGVFTLNGLSTIGSRVDLSGLTLVLADGNKNLQIGGAAFAENKFLTWSGDANNNWDITSINWTDDADGSPIKFLDGDAVTFDTDATPDAVINIEGTQKTVAQMVVGGDEDLTINGNILADNTLSTLDGTPGIDGGLTKNGSGMLMLNGDDRFKGDVTLNGGTLEVTGSITAPVLVMNNGTTFVNGTASPENVKFSQLDVHGSANWQGNLDMANNLMNFYVPATMGNGGVMLDVDGMANIAGATVNVGIDGASSPLHAGDHIVLIDANKLTGTTSNTIADGSGMHGVTLKYDFRIETMGDQLWATLLDSSINPQTKALSEGFLAGTTLLNHTGGRISGSGMNGAVAAAKRERICGYGIFGDISGNRSRYDTESNSGSNSGSSAGSNIDLSGMSVIAGVSKCLPSNSGFLTVGAFFDYGTGSYDTFNAFDNAESVRGNGKLNHFGGGVLGRMDFHNQFYAETGFRAGRLSNDYYSADLRDGAGRAASFDAASAYYGLHAGVGKWWSFTNKATLDIYAKYLWSGLQNNSVTLSTGDPVAFQSVNSHRLQLGGRYAFGTIRQSPFSGVWQQFSPYLGAAWEQEFDGTARATTRGNAIDAPSLRGGTGIGEAGIAWNPAARRGFHADLGVQGYIGKREGIVASLFVEQKF